MIRSKFKVLLFGIVIITGAAIIFLRNEREERKGSNGKEITVIIDYGDGGKRQFRGDGVAFMKDENAWSVLQRAAASASIPLEVSRGFYPVIINGKRTGEEGKRWVFYVNGERFSNGTPLETAIKAGDEVIWRFE